MVLIFSTIHQPQEIITALFKRGYIFVEIEGGITGDTQVNCTVLHSRLKDWHRKQEQELMAKRLRENPGKILQPSREKMIKMIHDPHIPLAKDWKWFKYVRVTSALDDSEDYLVSGIYSLKKIAPIRMEMCLISLTNYLKTTVVTKA